MMSTFAANNDASAKPNASSLAPCFHIIQIGLGIWQTFKYVFISQYVFFWKTGSAKCYSAFRLLINGFFFPLTCALSLLVPSVTEKVSRRMNRISHQFLESGDIFNQDFLGTGPSLHFQQKGNIGYQLAHEHDTAVISSDCHIKKTL